MSKDICIKCGKNVKKILPPKALKCNRCNLVFCKECSPVIGGLIIKRKGCPECGAKL